MLNLIPPISAIIVDHENIPVSQELEKLVQSQAEHPLRIKIAIANFTNREKCTKRLHKEGYVQLNVPQFTNSADAQVIIAGCFFFLSHPNLKQIFICSKDRIFEHLKNALFKFGIEVILVNENPLESAKDNIKNEKKKKSKKKSDISLEKKILIVLEEVAKKQGKKQVLLTHICTEFSKKYGEKITISIKKNHSNIRLVTYLKQHNFVLLLDDKQRYCLSVG
ncbi:hypothetical protein H1P_4940004 [Hyella patelloides LEGE 07179]|uniref:NYN domain-containing protein n=1 Tax=Hyella patelloides LEGE 07179 TaxID=945734 RepID=A0A563VZC6_9CYAN|nr:NYN domain-containing protein [Hyella patelloides]VEP16776.1 hypothetical protein H1P_4940004 [Hyella patelloides LEGE 07179]